MTRHLLILVGNVTPDERAAVGKVITENSNHWFNYTENAWIVCTSTEPSSFVAMLSESRFTTTNVYHVVFDISEVKASGGWLPQAAWNWLRSHHMWQTGG